MNQGWISIHRSIQEHWIWANEKYLKYWMLILLNVNHEPKKFPVGNEIFVCSPGQSFRSIQQWTDLFGCSKKTTVKFFEMLKRDDMISTEILGNGNRRKHLLTVVNWDKYQKTETRMFRERKPECSVNGNPNVTPNNNENNVNNENNENKIPLTPKGIDSNLIFSEIEFPESFKNDFFKKTLLSWLEYKNNKRQSYKSDKAIQELVNQLHKFSDGEPRKASEIVKISMANNWAGVFPLKTSAHQVSSLRDPKLSKSGYFEPL